VNENVFNPKKWILGGGGGGDSGAARLLYIGNTVHKRGYTRGLTRFVRVDKEMDRFDLEESLYTILIFPFPLRLKRKHSFPLLMKCYINIYHTHTHTQLTS